jgi:DNA mismatch repair protein MSH6
LKKLSRYWTPTIRKLVTEYKEALETKNSIVKSFTSRVYSKFDEHYFTWLSAVKHIAEIDCLLSLATSSMALGEPVCRPEFVESDKSVLELENLRHPCIAAGVATDFIPNDTYLGGDRPNMIVLTGPNMGGKSTLLRQTCVAIIMAQLGCYVPASRCKMTPFDRIYTRIGANDNILAGQSTFMVELSETSKILHEATPHSMVILDELGRGTSTFDGYAIAYSVLHYLATHVGCLGLFSTHYQTLCQEFERAPEVVNMHM